MHVQSSPRATAATGPNNRDNGDVRLSLYRDHFGCSRRVTALDELSPLDSAFLRIETHDTSLAIASLAVFDGPAPSYHDFAERLDAKLALVPRYRQRVRELPWGLGRPIWVDAPDFDITRHLKHTSLPRPGDARQLERLVGRVLSQPLDRRHPMWEDWLVEGLADGRWAVISKLHHCLADGIAGTGLMSRVFDHSAIGDPLPVDEWVPQPGPSRLRMLATLGGELGALPGTAVSAVRDGVRDPRRTLRTVLAGARGLTQFARLADRVTRTTLSGRIGPSRVWTRTRIDLDDVRRIRKALGGTVNDVVLAAVTRGYRDLLLERQDSLDPGSVRALIPVSVRRDHGRVDNEVSAVVATLPVHLADPLARLTAVRAEMDRLKQSGEALAGAQITEAARFAPPVLLNAGLTGVFRVPQPFVTTVVTNVPGPAEPLYALGCRLREMYPYVPIADQLRVGVAISSYVGTLYVGITADRDSTSDADVLRDGIEAAIADLVELAT